MRKMTKRSAIITATAVAAVGVGAAAWATGWSLTGEGTATADAAEIKPLSATGSISGKIYPGATAGVTLKIVNDNDFPATFTASSIALRDVEVTKGDADGTCKKSLPAQLVTGTTLSGTPRIEANESADVTAEVTIGALPQVCAGKSFTLKYTFAGVSTV